MRYLLLYLSLVALGAGWLANHFHDKAAEWRDAAQQSKQLLKQQVAANEEIQTRLRSVAALDAKYMKELTDAQATIEQLQRDVSAGRKRLQLNARCSVVPAGKAASAAGMDDAASARLTDAAERDYFILRSRITYARTQILGLQEYILKQCLN